VPQEIILDCDPGIDDAFAIAFAWGHPDLEISGITTVAGNVSLDKATTNALRVCEFLGADRLPVVAGSSRPLLRTPLTARRIWTGRSTAPATHNRTESWPRR